MEKTKDLTSSSEAGSIKKRSQVKEVWRRFCRNKQAMVGMCMLLLLIFAAIFADIIAPYDPVEQDHRHLPIGSEPTNWDAIFSAVFSMEAVFPSLSV